MISTMFFFIWLYWNRFWQNRFVDFPLLMWHRPQHVLHILQRRPTTVDPWVPAKMVTWCHSTSVSPFDHDANQTSSMWSNRKQMTFTRCHEMSWVNDSKLSILLAQISWPSKIPSKQPPPSTQPRHGPPSFAFPPEEPRYGIHKKISIHCYTIIWAKYNISPT